MTEQTTLDFTMDPNLLVSVIKTQAGSLSKALLEGVMNSIDAGASRVDVTVTTDGFTIVDNGRGFTSEQEIKELFGRFGTPHVEGDALYGRFRMGRGQMMAYAATVWRSGPFQMTVDIEKDGLTYKLARLETPVKGCIIEGKLYHPVHEYMLRVTLEELRLFVAYTPKPVYVNGELYGAKPERLTSWTCIDDDAFYRIVPGADSLKIYNLGVFVEQRPTWKTGAGGVVVSKKALKVNFARNSVLEDQCFVWKRINEKLESLVMGKLAGAKALSEDERKYAAGRLRNLYRYPYLRWREIKLLTDPTGRHMPLSTLSCYKRFVHIPEAMTSLACAVHGVDGTFVVTDKLLNRFSVTTLDDFIGRLKQLPGILPPEYEVVSAESLAPLGLGGAKTVETEGLAKRELAAFRALVAVNDMLAAQLSSWEGATTQRELRAGIHRAGTFVAWTDGKTYITVNRKYLKWFSKGVDGVLEWILTLIHEYTHDNDDSESHEHGEVFYRKYHDTVTASTLQLATLARAGAKEYLRQLKLLGVPRPRKLMNQLRE